MSVTESVGEAATPHGEPLSRRELQIVYGLLDGGRVATLAEALSLSKETIRHYLKSIFQKFGVHSQAELLAQLKRNDWQQLPAMLQSRAELEAFIDIANQRLLDRARALLGRDFDLASMMTDVVLDALPITASAQFEWKVRFQYLALHSAEDSNAASASDALSPQAKAVEASHNILSLFAEQGALPPGIDVASLNHELLDLIRSVAFRLLSNTGPPGQELQALVRVKVVRLLAELGSTKLS